ncbi:WYL domain-containing protein, partial [Clostridium perfringens]|uniref:WYL domain-containing protein n=1 Tax=Clostridium perfringens TaxID=1502 RepID=UPI002AC5FDCE
YLYGYCRRRKDNRFFKLTRINNLNTLSENFMRVIPNKVLIEEDKEYADALINLKLKINKKMAFRVYDEFQKYYLDKNPYFIVNIDFPLGEWLFGYIMSFGENVEVIEPEYIREELKKRLKCALNNY